MGLRISRWGKTVTRRRPGADYTTKEVIKTEEKPPHFWQYEEDKTLKEVRDYLSGTYRAHYTSKESKTQTLDLIESIGDAEAFTRSNAIKYLSRFGKKDGKSKLDILKASTIVFFSTISLDFIMQTKTPLKLSDRTVNLLRNFSSINQSILFKEGN